MTTVNLLMNSLAVAAPFTPPPTNYIEVGTEQGKTDGTRFAKNGLTQQACWAYNVELTGEWFPSGRDDKEACGDKCRTRKHRQKIRDELDLDDE